MCFRIDFRSEFCFQVSKENAIRLEEEGNAQLMEYFRLRDLETWNFVEKSDIDGVLVYATNITDKDGVTSEIYKTIVSRFCDFMDEGPTDWKSAGSSRCSHNTLDL